MKAYIFTGRTEVAGVFMPNGAKYIVVGKYKLHAWRIFREKFPKANIRDWKITKLDLDSEGVKE